MKTPARKYSIKDVDFVITADTIIDSAIANQPFLETKRANWTMPFLQDIKNQIDKATQDHLGVDNAKQLRQASQEVYTIVAVAMNELAEVKVQIQEDFKDTPAQRTEILNTLGFTTYAFDASKGDQEALINLLFQFKKNLTQQLNDEIVAKGTSQTTIDTVISRADALKQADVFQEGKKGTRKELTNEALTAFNDIYNKIITIAKISNKFYKDNPPLKEQFSFSKVKSNLNKNTSTPKK